MRVPRERAGQKRAELRSRVYHFPLSTTNNGITTRVISHIAG